MEPTMRLDLIAGSSCMTSKSAPLDERFDAIICYDSLHHFQDEQAVLANLNAMIDYGGQFFLIEGRETFQENF